MRPLGWCETMEPPPQPDKTVYQYDIYITKNPIYRWRPNHRHKVDTNVVHGDIKQNRIKQIKT